MTRTAMEPRTEEWELTQLKAHPQQADMFGDLPPGVFEELKRDIQAHGLQELIEILPDGTIISGHQRRRVLQELGIERHDVWVRHDLAEADKAVIEDEFLTANTARRQLSPLAQVRIHIRRLELKRGRPFAKMQVWEWAPLRQQLTTNLNMSRRNVTRYLAVLRTPRAVQDAFEAERITLQHAAKVATLPKNVQEQLAKALPQAEDPKAAVNGCFRTNRKPQSVWKQYQSMLVALHWAKADIRPNLAYVATAQFEEDMEDLKDGIRFFKELMAHLKEQKREDEEWRKEFNKKHKTASSARSAD